MNKLYLPTKGLYCLRIGEKDYEGSDRPEPPKDSNWLNLVRYIIIHRYLRMKNLRIKIKINMVKC